MISEQLYVWHHTHFIYDILGTIHNVTSTLWVHTIVVTILHTLHSWNHTHYIRHHTHDNTKVISTISHFISDTTSTVSVSSNPVYQLYYTHSLYDITHYMYDITFSLHDITWTLYDISAVWVWHHIQYIYDIISNIYDITLTVSWNKTSIPGISPTVFDITFSASVWSHLLYQCLHNNYGSLHTWHMYDTINTLHHIKFRLYDINHQYLGHHNHCIYDIRSSIYDITSTIYYISSPIPVTSQPLYWYHNTHYVCKYISTIFDMKHTVLSQCKHYTWHHTLHVCVCVITPTISMIKHTLYLWHHVSCIYGKIGMCKVFHPRFMTSKHSWHQTIISHLTPIISDSTSTVSLSSHPDYRS